MNFLDCPWAEHRPNLVRAVAVLAQRGYELQRDDPVSIRHAIEAFLSDLVLDRGGFDLLDADDDQRRCSVAENQVMRKCWRINPDQALDYQVERLARRESRSVSNMLFVLIKEALAARARGEHLSVEPRG